MVKVNCFFDPFWNVIRVRKTNGMNILNLKRTIRVQLLGLVLLEL